MYGQTNGTVQFAPADVATGPGVTRQTVYRYLPSTVELFTAVDRRGR